MECSVIMMVGVEGFGRRLEPMQVRLRRWLHDVVGRAVAESGLDFGAVPPRDRRDGAMWLLPDEISKVGLAGRFVDRLQEGLRDYGWRATSESALRLRLALHAGEVTRDVYGWSGADLATACRLVELSALKETLALARRAGLAVAVTRSWYDGVVRHGEAETHPEAYRQVAFQGGDVDSTAWIRVPGYDAPPGVVEVGSSYPVLTDVRHWRRWATVEPGISIAGL